MKKIGERTVPRPVMGDSQLAFVHVTSPASPGVDTGPCGGSARTDLHFPVIPPSSWPPRSLSLSSYTTQRSSVIGHNIVIPGTASSPARHGSPCYPARHSNLPSRPVYELPAPACGISSALTRRAAQTPVFPRNPQAASSRSNRGDLCAWT